MSLEVVPVTLKQAKEFVAAHHRHHSPPVGHKVSLGVELHGNLVGVAILGRPVARALQDGRTIEITRTATTGEPNACSKLLGAARKVAFALGYHKVITYNQDTESGASLRGAGFRPSARRRPRPGWDTPSRPRRPLGTEQVGRILWVAP